MDLFWVLEDIRFVDISAVGSNRYFPPLTILVSDVIMFGLSSWMSLRSCARAAIYARLLSGSLSIAWAFSIFA